MGNRVGGPLVRLEGRRATRVAARLGERRGGASHGLAALAATLQMYQHAIIG